MQIQGTLQSFGEPLQGNIADPFSTMGSGPKSTIDSFVRIQHEDGKGLVGIVLKQRQIEPVGRDHPDAHELLQQRFQNGICVNEIVIKLDTFFAGNAAEHHNDGLARFLRHVESLREVVVDPEALLSDPLLIFTDFLVSSFLFLTGGNPRGEAHQNRQN